jgi:hypothetical protein
VPCRPDISDVPISSKTPGDWPVISLQQNVAVSVNVVIEQEIPATIEVTDPSSSSSSSAPSSLSSGYPLDPTAAVTIVFTSPAVVAKVKLWMSQHATDPQIVSVAGTRINSNLFRFDFTQQNLSKSGLFLGDIILFDSDNNPIFVKKTYVEIERNATDAYMAHDPLTISDVRLAMRDGQEVNSLIDDVEFSNREIQQSLRRPVDLFNETQPSVACFNYADFPYREHHLAATTGFLLKLAAHWYRRNYKQMSGAGITIDDKARFEEYDREGDKLLAEYKEWCENEQVRINIGQSFGGFGGWRSGRL